MLRSLRFAGRAALAFGSVGAGFAACLPAPESFATPRPPTVVRSTGFSAASEPPLILEYFALRGLGELARLVLECAGVPYDCVFHFQDGAYQKYAGTFGQLPVLRDGDLILCESGAIVRHLARRYSLEGTTLAEKAMVDMYYELSQDLSDKRGAIYDLDGHEEAAGLKKLLGYAEAACDGSHFVGSSMTLADIAMFKALHFFQEVAPGSLSPYPRLSAFVHEFEQLPAVAAYLTSDKRMPLTANELGKAPHAGISGYKFLQQPPPGSYATTWEGLKT
mmetsp:Transcript_18500/g.58548  ORF Transcript_18500/g.58548 Transcript_18500/m.58548 type:complete len:277 (-) Transcript_18500:355-1185(-)|eukprot:scaffold22439_cov108-Isochrysis_galbana.AAC.1